MTDLVKQMANIKITKNNFVNILRYVQITSWLFIILCATSLWFFEMIGLYVGSGLLAIILIAGCLIQIVKVRIRNKITDTFLGDQSKDKVDFRQWIEDEVRNREY